MDAAPELPVQAVIAQEDSPRAASGIDRLREVPVRVVGVGLVAPVWIAHGGQAAGHVVGVIRAARPVGVKDLGQLADVVIGVFDGRMEGVGRLRVAGVALLVVDPAHGIGQRPDLMAKRIDAQLLLIARGVPGAVGVADHGVLVGGGIG